MERWSEIRHAVLVEGVSKRFAIKKFKIGSRTLDKILSNPEPPGYRAKVPRPKTKLGPYLEIIDQILADDLDAPKKQRHTSKRIADRLRSEHGYTGGNTQVYSYVAAKRCESREVFVPLTKTPGEAQYDFGQAQVVVDGTEVTAALSVMSLPFSDAFHISAFPRECTETFQGGHVLAYQFFDGVPTRISFDNTSIAVKKVVGRGLRDLTDGFLRLQSHYLFRSHFCNIRRGNEKGHVENLVGFARRNTLVPVPAFDSWKQLNQYLDACCFADLFRQVRSKNTTKGELLAIDREAMHELPDMAFEPARIIRTRANSLSLVRFESNDYSVPTAFAHHDLTVTGSIEQVKISAGTKVIALHRRSWAKQEAIYDPRHYLALLERKPGAIDFAKPLANWGLPKCFLDLRILLETASGSLGTREYIKILRLSELVTISTLSEAIEVALGLGITDADAIGLIVRHRSESAAIPFNLDGHSALGLYSIAPPDLGAYGALTTKG